MADSARAFPAGPGPQTDDYPLFTLLTVWNSIFPGRRLEGDVYDNEQLITRGNHG